MFYPHDAVSPDGLPVRPEIMQYHIEEVLKKTQKSATIGAIGLVLCWFAFVSPLLTTTLLDPHFSYR